MYVSSSVCCVNVPPSFIGIAARRVLSEVRFPLKDIVFIRKFSEALPEEHKIGHRILEIQIARSSLIVIKPPYIYRPP